MGATAARVLSAADDVSELVIADRDQRSATRVAEALGRKASPLQLDATDPVALVAAMRGCDLVVNTVGPFFRFAVPILTAAIDAGCDYIDICDDPEPTLRMLELDDRATTAGVTALIGAGASPGIANMLAVIAGRELDTVETLVTGWNIAAVHPEDTRVGRGPSAATVHAMAQISGDTPVVRGGRLVRRPALAKLAFSYPGIGAGHGRCFGHPEAVTLQRAFPELRDNTNVCVGDRFTMALLLTLRRLIGAGLLTADRAASLLERIQALFPSRPSDMIRSGAMPPLFAVATGTHEGRPGVAATTVAQIPGFSMAAATGVPLAVSALLLAASPRPGVHTPETFIDPAAFFAALAPHCIGEPTPQAMTVTTTSWASTATNRRAFNTSPLTALMAQPTNATRRS